MWLALLPSKDVTPVTIRRIQAATECKSGKLVHALCMDRGEEFLAKDFKQYCTELGLHHELMAPYSPQQNGVVEHRNQTVVGTAQSMLKVKGLPDAF
jgi:IS30 family transposase